MNPFYGQINCQAITKSGTACVNKAYYKTSDGTFNCGVHSDKANRTALKKNKDAINKAAAEIYSSHLKTLVCSPQRGKVILTKMYMMKNPPLIEGYLNVFPNFKHQNRKDGFGCSSLSPKSMGPVNHGQPGLPPAKNLENFHQGNKCFPVEITDGKPNKMFYANRLKMYNDSVPHRHKVDTAGKRISKENKPVCSIYVDKEGVEKQLSYVESRQLYCKFYELFTRTNNDFYVLEEKLNQGYNLNICGYDAYRPDQNLERCYLDDTKPFGHELVLYCLLTQKNPYPWDLHQTLNFL